MGVGAVAFAGEGGAGEVGFQAAGLAAPAGAERHFVGPGPGQGGMAEFAGEAVAAFEDLAVDDDAAHRSRCRG